MSDMINDSQSKQTKLEPRLLTAKQAAAYLNISLRTLYNRTGPKSRSPFPVRAKRIGRALRFDRRDIDAMIETL